jgi:hypothetical protein
MYGRLMMELLHGTLDGEFFGGFMARLKTTWENCTKIPQNIRNQGFIAVFDNVRSHRRQDIHNALVGTNHQFRFLPPWSPFLNPIEGVFSNHKALIKAEHIRQRPNLRAIDIAPRGTKMRDRTEILDNMATSSWDLIDDADVRQHFMNMHGYIQRCINEEIILS